MSCAKLKSQVETGIQKSKLEQQSSVNRAYFLQGKINQNVDIQSIL